MDFKIFKTSEYDFLRQNENLGEKVGMLVLGGSLAYGTNLPNKGDIDLRGFAFEKPSGLIGVEEPFQQIVETNTDTVIYGFNKFLTLLLENNPNSIELLGCRPEHYVYKTELAEELIANRTRFLSQRCFYSFGGYAGQQLARLENAIARDSLSQSKKEEHIRMSMENAMFSFSERYTAFDKGGIKLYIAESDKEDLDTEVVLDINLTKYPAREFNSILNELTNIVRQYGKLNHRNKKKDDEHLNKHAMHLIRLYLMVIDILENFEINTFREKEQSELLAIRLGKYLREDGTYDPTFYEYLNILKARYEYAKKHTMVPEKADMEWVNYFKMKVNKKIIMEEI